jgi:hypothetical protein
VYNIRGVFTHYPIRNSYISVIRAIMKMHNLLPRDVYQAAKLTYFDFLNGLASKEEDFRCIFYFHLRNIKHRYKSNDTILLNPAKFGKYPDIVIIQENSKISYIELKQNIDFNESSKRELVYDIDKLQLYKSKDKNYKQGYLIHFYRNFQKWSDIDKLVNKKKGITNIYFPNEEYERLTNKYLSNKHTQDRIITKSLIHLKDRGIVKKGMRSEIQELLGEDSAAGWIPINTNIERDEYLTGGYKKVIKSTVNVTRNSNRPVRFYSDILKLSKYDLNILTSQVETSNKDLIDLVIVLKINELTRAGFLSLVKH